MIGTKGSGPGKRVRPERNSSGILIVVEATQDDLRRLIRRLDPDPAVAWEMYLTLWQKLVMFFERNNCPPASDHADEALSRIARRPDLDVIQNVGAFAYGVARKMRSEIYEKLKREVPIEDLPGGTVAIAQNVEVELVERIDLQTKARCFEQCIQRLPADERAIFLAFELADPASRADARSKLAAQTRISAGALRVRVFRIRREIERCARKCLINRGKSAV